MSDLALEPSEFTWYAAADTSDTDTTGGKLNYLRPVSPNTIGGFFETISTADRLDGVLKKAKFFAKVEGVGNFTFGDAKIYLYFAFPENGITLSLLPGTASNVYGDVKNGRKYGVGVLASTPTYNDVTDETTIVVSTKGEAYHHFVYNANGTGNKIAILDRSSPTDSTGHEEFHSIIAASYSGSQCTLKISGQLRHSYATTRAVNGETIPTRVASCVEFGDVKCAYSVLNNTSINGTYDTTKLLPRNIGAINQTITITFESANSFVASSNVADITLTGGAKNTTWEPADLAGNPYLAVPSSFWTNNGNGDWQAGDTVQIHTEPAAASVFVEIDVGANSNSFAAKSFYLGVHGNSK